MMRSGWTVAMIALSFANAAAASETVHFASAAPLPSALMARSIRESGDAGPQPPLADEIAGDGLTLAGHRHQHNEAADRAAAETAREFIRKNLGQ